MTCEEIRDYFLELDRCISRGTVQSLDLAQLEVTSRQLESHKHIILSFIILLSDSQQTPNIITLNGLLHTLYIEINSLVESLSEQIYHFSQELEVSGCSHFFSNVVRAGEVGRPRYTI